MRIVYGDLFETDCMAIGHGVNCVGVMGAGIATIFKKKYPLMYRSYNYSCKTRHLTPGGLFSWFDDPSGKWIYNMASQDAPGPYARLEWLEEAAHNALTHAESFNIPEVAIPQIGCGIGGLDFDEVSSLLNNVDKSYRSKFVMYLLA